ncbi:F420-dependent oxidoreductase-like protein [Thermosporothrix hazakensis]|jgi:F420-dependent oxidoreductase-like protein|uniref:F420-dependent oxidoreductase-like protein n=2 Tax=Thermosporothrix hazakensis TaxID=644383 RepID=A0A326U3L5_THEHA|nr:F420-dependent oxidoreductase-like protein [Thermosporothrix hazakensis]GCE47610.1 LLM class F420-dependent oxidoreductase [Thermosporothrix hazakensis]
MFRMSETHAARRQYRVGFVADSPNFPAAWNDVVEKVRIADELGFDSVWLGESWGYELFTSLADLVRATQRIKIGAGIANIYSRSPAVLASSAATLDERSGGRFLLGLGPSGANVIEHWHGVRFEKPLQRTREYIEIIRMILRGEKLIYHGTFFKLERGFKLRFTPPRSDLPIYVAAMGPKNIIQTGEIADGVMPIYWPCTKWGDLRALLDEGARKAGRVPHSAMIAPYITTALLPENVSEERRQEARSAAAMPLAYYVGKMGTYYADMLRRNGFEAEVQAIIDGWQKGIKSAIAAVSPRLLDAVALVGTPREVVARLDQWAEWGVDEPLLTMPEGPVDEVAALLQDLKEALA